MLDGATAADAVAAPRAVAGPQEYGCTADSVVVEADVEPAAATALAASGLTVVEVPGHSEGLGQANVVQVGLDGALAAAADPRADGSAVVVQYARHHRAG
jgi:gamma-glutamyltranspeptidase